FKSKILIPISIIVCLLLVFTLSMAACKTTTVETTAQSETTENIAPETTAAATTAESVQEQEKVTITVTDWRTEDMEAMNKINAAFMEKYPNITVKFDPIKNTEYFAQLQTALETKSDKYDIIGLFPFGVVKTYYDNGYTLALNDLVKNLSNIPKDILAKYSSGGSVVAVPVAAVAHGIYYNKDIFAKYNLQEPKTWADFIATCDILKKNGENVIAQGAVDSWTLSDAGYSNYGANFFGGEKTRQKLMAGEIKFTDDRFIKAFKALESLKQYFVTGYQSIDYVGMQQLFKTGQAAIMIAGGSWEIAGFKASKGLNFGWFAPPVEKAGDKLQLCFLSDLGFGISKYSKNPDAAATYLDWVSTSEFAQLFMKNVPGFYSYVPGDYTLDPIALKMLDAAKNADLTERLMVEKLSDKSPSGSELLGESSVKLVLGEFTPQQAAENVQKNLETWYTFK
ncbi:MAG: ABC transporter substrate-binding protein, partial [Candidatus Humimicrobiaceae bacterium]